MRALLHPKHPIWLIAMMLALGIVFALQAKTFDADEIRNWFEVVGVVAIREFLGRRSGGSTNELDG